MSVKGITTTTGYSSYSQDYTSTSSTKTTSDTAKTPEVQEQYGAIYEPSNTSNPGAIQNSYRKIEYIPDKELIAKLQADTESKSENMRNLVQKILSQQTNSYAKANDMWSFLADGNFSVDAATKTQAQADISENGYWGVSQTSDRIVDFAKAITGNDPTKIEEMRKAFQKGFDMATKTWGKKLPEISQKTYDAVMQKFDAWQADSQA